MHRSWIPAILFLFLLLFLPALSFQQTAIEKKQSPVITTPSRFDHNRKEHGKEYGLECSTCHVRTDNSTKLNFPYHTACVDCHVKDFTSKESRLCDDCHGEKVDPKGSTVQFPGKLDNFGVYKFSHRDHTNTQKMPREHYDMIACDSCHHFDLNKLLASFPSHPECYTCHNHQATQKQGTCETCHGFRNESIPYLKTLSVSYTDYKFTHDKHLKDPTIRNNCQESRCHATVQMEPGMTVSDVNRIVPVLDSCQNGKVIGENIHNSGCFKCHDKNAKGKYTNCLTCHSNASIARVTKCS